MGGEAHRSKGAIAMSFVANRRERVIEKERVREIKSVKVREMGKGRVPAIREKEKRKRKGDFKKCPILATMIIYAPPYV